MNKSDVTPKLENSEANEEVPDFFQAEEFNISDPMVSSNCSNSGTTQIAFEQLTSPNSVGGEQVEEIMPISRNLDVEEKTKFPPSQNKKNKMRIRKSSIVSSVQKVVQKEHQNNKNSSEIEDNTVDVQQPLENNQEFTQNKRKYQCKICEKEFATSQNMHKHINTVHKKKKDHHCTQ